MADDIAPTIDNLRLINHALDMALNDPFVFSTRYKEHYNRLNDDELQQLAQNPEGSKALIDKFETTFQVAKDLKEKPVTIKDGHENLQVQSTEHSWQDVLNAVSNVWAGSDNKGNADKGLSIHQYAEAIKGQVSSLDFQRAEVSADHAYDEQKMRDSQAKADARKLARLHTEDGKWAAMNYALAGAGGFRSDAFGYIDTNKTKVENFSIAQIEQLQVDFKAKFQDQLKGQNYQTHNLLRAIEATYSEGKDTDPNTYLAKLDVKLKELNPSVVPDANQPQLAQGGSQEGSQQGAGQQQSSADIDEIKKLQVVLAANNHRENWDGGFKDDGKKGRHTTNDTAAYQKELKTAGVDVNTNGELDDKMKAIVDKKYEELAKGRTYEQVVASLDAPANPAAPAADHGTQTASKEKAAPAASGQQSPGKTAAQLEVDKILGQDIDATQKAFSENKMHNVLVNSQAVFADREFAKELAVHPDAVTAEQVSASLSAFKQKMEHLSDFELRTPKALPGNLSQLVKEGKGIPV